MKRMSKVRICPAFKNFQVVKKEEGIKRSSNIFLTYQIDYFPHLRKVKMKNVINNLMFPEVSVSESDTGFLHVSRPDLVQEVFDVEAYGYQGLCDIRLYITKYLLTNAGYDDYIEREIEYTIDHNYSSDGSGV